MLRRMRGGILRGLDPFLVNDSGQVLVDNPPIKAGIRCYRRFRMRMRTCRGEIGR